MYPAHDIPVLQLSLQSYLGPQHHLLLGKAIAALRQDNVLVIGSGSFTHNLGRLRRVDPDAPPPPDVVAFSEWMYEALAEHRMDDLLAYRTQGALRRRAAPDRGAPAAAVRCHGRRGRHRRGNAAARQHDLRRAADGCLRVQLGGARKQTNRPARQSTPQWTRLLLGLALYRKPEVLTHGPLTIVMPTKVGICGFSCCPQRSRGWRAFARHDEWRTAGESRPSAPPISRRRSHRSAAAGLP